MGGSQADGGHILQGIFFGDANSDCAVRVQDIACQIMISPDGCQGAGGITTAGGEFRVASGQADRLFSSKLFH